MDRAGLTVFFEDPFWVGVFERYADGKLSVCRVVFGAEPTDREIYAFILGRYRSLRFGPSIDAVARASADNPKHRRRQARAQLRRSGAGTKAQQALQQQREASKQLLERQSREQHAQEKQRRFMQKQQKRREKHKGH